MAYYAAIDQGGSKTEAVVFTEEGEILSFGDDRDLRIPGQSYAKLQGKWLRYACEKALHPLGLSEKDLSGACCSLNGADWPEDYERLRRLVFEELGIAPSEILIVNDCVGAMRGGTDDPNRGVICAGTGMNCAVHKADGSEYIYGYFVNSPDQGGGALGTKVWQSVLDAYTGVGPKTCLSQMVLEKYGENDLISLYKKFTSGQIPFKNYEFCPLLMRAAKQHDSVAQEILSAEAERMVRYIDLAMKKLHFGEEVLTLVLTGGVFKGDGDIFFHLIEEEIRRRELLIQCTKPQFEPVAGAALLELDHLGRSCEEEVRRRFTVSAEKRNLIWR